MVPWRANMRFVERPMRSIWGKGWATTISAATARIGRTGGSVLDSLFSTRPARTRRRLKRPRVLTGTEVGRPAGRRNTATV